MWRTRPVARSASTPRCRERRGRGPRAPILARAFRRSLKAVPNRSDTQLDGFALCAAAHRRSIADLASVVPGRVGSDSRCRSLCPHAASQWRGPFTGGSGRDRQRDRVRERGALAERRPRQQARRRSWNPRAASAECSRCDRHAQRQALAVGWDAGVRDACAAASRQELRRRRGSRRGSVDRPHRRPHRGPDDQQRAREPRGVARGDRESAHRVRPRSRSLGPADWRIRGVSRNRPARRGRRPRHPQPLADRPRGVRLPLCGTRTARPWRFQEDAQSDRRAPGPLRGVAGVVRPTRAELARNDRDIERDRRGERPVHRRPLAPCPRDVAASRPRARPVA